MLDKKTADALLPLLMEHTGFPVEILETKPVGGGSINTALLLQTDKGRFFLKQNKARRYPGMFEAEARGLRLLSGAGTFVVPQVIAAGAAGDEAFLLMTFLGRGLPAENGWREAGRRLAQLHRLTHESFGLDHDNYIGSLPQSNRAHPDWPSFFAEERILAQVKMAYDDRRLTAAVVKQAEKLCQRLDEIFPAEKPALLHGDLWSGNFMFSGAGPAVYDPAVYFGHRETDLAMTQLFGGFDAEFYEGYQEEFPLEKNWRRRTDYSNLYPLLVHVNLFGGGYISDVQAILREF